MYTPFPFSCRNAGSTAGALQRITASLGTASHGSTGVVAAGGQGVEKDVAKAAQPLSMQVGIWGFPRIGGPPSHPFSWHRPL